MTLMSALLKLFVMAGFIPAIHVFFGRGVVNTWMAGTSPAMTSGRPGDNLTNGILRDVLST
jgi:hypothetical protein